MDNPYRIIKVTRLGKTHFELQEHNGSGIYKTCIGGRCDTFEEAMHDLQLKLAQDKLDASEIIEVVYPK